MTALDKAEELLRAVDAGRHWSGRALALLHCGTDVHARDDQALRVACMDGNAQVARELVLRGADVHALSDEALRYASIEGNEEVVRLLLGAGGRRPRVRR